MTYQDLITKYIRNNSSRNCREPIKNVLPYPYLVPGSSYSNQLWDWDSWLTGLALINFDSKKYEKYAKGCVLNFLNSIDEEGRIPLLIQDTPCFFLKYGKNIHKPCLAIQANEIAQKYHDYQWLKKDFNKFISFISYYYKKQYDNESGLFYWHDDLAIGFDNNPAVFYRPNNSTGDIFLNSLMYLELISVSEIASKLNKKEIAKEYKAKANKLKEAINNECYDPIDGFYYSVDLSLKKVNKKAWLHSGHPRFWHSLPIKIKTWAGLLPLYCGIANKEQAKNVVRNYLDKNSLFSNYGIRSIGKNEKMYCIKKTGNPSCWLGPIWINANYFTYVGLKKYGFIKEANDIKNKTIKLLGEDLKVNKEFHEYYHPDTGKGVFNKGFQSWNFLVYLMLKD